MGGVAGALAAKTGFDITVVRVVLLLATLISGVGFAVYVAGWVVLPAEDEPESIGARALHDSRGLAMAVALFPALILTLLIASALRAGWLGSLAWPLFFAAAGVVLIWRNGGERDRAVLNRAVTPLRHLGGASGQGGRVLVWRVVLGLALAAGAVAIFAVGDRGAVLRPVAGVVLVLAAFVVLFGPWWLRVVRDLMDERQARLRAEQTAELASRVHDSVLQTLAMIQRNSGDPQRVAQLARSQERELRSWLFEGRPPGSFNGRATTVADAVAHIQADVEADHGVRVETVVVGNCPLTDDLESLLAAGREATVNAAKWSGVDTVSLFVEVEEGQVSLFVRDRGKGFDPAAVDHDRRGIAESIKGRMARVGGRSEVRSSPGHGTEVVLSVRRSTETPPVTRSRQ